MLVVDDSDFQRGLVTGILETDPGIEIVGQAKDGAEAIEKTLKLAPDVITMDIRMPVMDGIQATREIMAAKPTPIVVTSGTIRDEQEFTFRCLKQGALDFVAFDPEKGIVAEDLILKVKLCSRIAVVTHPRGGRLGAPRPRPTRRERYEIVGIAVSTGGPVALREILDHLPKDFPVPILIVQHISEGFTQGLAEWLTSESPMKVIVAKEGDRLKPGTAYLAPSGWHLTVDEEERIRLSEEDLPGNYHKPSADVMLQSIADVYGARAIGLIMTGMGKDGTRGIKAIREAMGFTMAQDEASSVIYGMNKVAIEEGSVIEVVPLDQIAQALRVLVSQEGGAPPRPSRKLTR